MVATIAAVLTEDPPPLLRGEALRAVVDAPLAKDPHLRPTTDQAATALLYCAARGGRRDEDWISTHDEDLP